MFLNLSGYISDSPHKISRRKILGEINERFIHHKRPAILLLFVFSSIRCSHQKFLVGNSSRFVLIRRQNMISPSYK